MTHRVFSRNAASSRAIPVAKMLERVENDPAMPIHWGKNQAGMQAREELNPSAMLLAKVEWRDAAKEACYVADSLHTLGLHKQVANRVLEPFQHIKVICTATEWDNFFKLRLHPDAQPEIQELARVMKEAMDNSKPVLLRPGQWHTPYMNNYSESISDYAIKCAVARCARVSYLNHDNSIPDNAKDTALHDTLLAAGHMSPFEHVATPMPYPFSDVDWNEAWETLNKGATHVDRQGNVWSGNFRGWIQYRATLC